MTPKDFTDAVTHELRRRGANFRPEDVEAFTALTWIKKGRRPDPDLCAEQFLAQMARRRRTRLTRPGAPPWDTRVWAAGGATAALLIAAAFGYAFAHWPASTLAIAAVVLLIAALTLSRVPIDSSVLRWVLLVAVLSVLSVAALVVLLVTRCHL